MKAAPVVLAISLAFSATLATAQSSSPPIRPATTVRTLYLKNATQPNDLNEILTTIRNMLPAYDRVYGVQTQNAIVLDSTPEEFQLAERLVGDLDRPRKAYRLSYTITELDGTKRIATQHISLNVVAGNATTMKQENHIPNGGSGNSWFDVGFNVTATVLSLTDTASLHTRMEQSSFVEEPSSAPVRGPESRRTSLDDDSMLQPGKPAMLGSLDLPGTTHHLEIEALIEPLR